VNWGVAVRGSPLMPGWGGGETWETFPGAQIHRSEYLVPTGIDRYAIACARCLLVHLNAFGFAVWLV
jgi:hypothetical protein